MSEEDENRPKSCLDLRHVGRFYDKEMPIEQAGMEMAKPGLPDLRRRKHSIRLPGDGPDPAQTVR
ncbi:MAG: hypothetical protein M3T49_01015 [Candidatus Eremiobacteraeota bacterium]|nr:hypothetical protein [Candidatus Eremiobacteraeota bacterium]